ncbi:hypothetical protein ACIBP6_14575 [Nonomuraea terrae]|uniref:hypothetical protein n=1 Tax=Nonomuraea terrae TaxID=2530383 RepID=UPI00378AE3BE
MALHRYGEGIVPVSRERPWETRRLIRAADPAANALRAEQIARLDRFVQRAADERVLRPDVPSRAGHAP